MRIVLRLAKVSPFELVVVSLLIITTFEFSVNFPFSNVITLRTGEFCTKILVFGNIDPFVLFVTCSVIDPFDCELGNPMAPSESSKDVDLTPFDDIEVFVVVPFDVSALCFGEFFGEYVVLRADWVAACEVVAIVLAELCESKLE